MAATPTKIIDGKPAASDALTNQLTVRRPKCEQTCRLGYSDGEWHRLQTWQHLAEKVLRIFAIEYDDR